MQPGAEQTAKGLLVPGQQLFTTLHPPETQQTK